MHAVVLTGHGGLDKLELREDVPRPSPAAGEVLVQVGACGLNNTDVNTRTGWYDREVESAVSEDFGLHGQGDAASTWNQTAMSFPRIQGAAVVGSVAAVGGGVAGSLVGERVIVDPSIRDRALPLRAQLLEYLGSERDGGYAEYTVVPAANAHRIRSELSDAELATFPCSYETAEEMLVRAGLWEGETILVTGAGGGVGTALIQLARLRHARVVAIAAAAKESRLRQLGAHEFIPREDGDLRGQVERLLGPRGVDVVADVVGGAIFGDLLKVLRRGGRYATAGAIAGPRAGFDLRDLIYKDLEMYGVTNPTADTFASVVRAVESGKLRPILDRTFALCDLREAQAELLRRTHVGKIVAVP